MSYWVVIAWADYSFFWHPGLFQIRWVDRSALLTTDAIAEEAARTEVGRKGKSE